VIVVNHRSTLLQPVDKLGIIRNGVLEKFGDRDELLRETAPKKPTLVPVGGGAFR
jgi:ABC-type protease/lipase transport system fused ATPase/permease subunit